MLEIYPWRGDAYVWEEFVSGVGSLGADLVGAV